MSRTFGALAARCSTLAGDIARDLHDGRVADTPELADDDAHVADAFSRLADLDLTSLLDFVA